MNTKKNSGHYKRKIKLEYQNLIQSDVMVGNPSTTIIDNSEVLRRGRECNADHTGHKLRCGLQGEPSNDTNSPPSSTINQIKFTNSFGQARHENYYEGSAQENIVDYIYSSEEEEEYMNECDKNMLFRNRIQNWAVTKNITLAALKDLAKIMNDKIPNILPNDPRTIMCTPRHVDIRSIEGGEYWHNGIKFPLTQILEAWANVPEEISLNINMDGLPIYKSAKKEFWPILCNIFEKTDLRPFIIGIYFGTGKPKNLNEYLHDFVIEMKNILKDGITIITNQCEKKIIVKIRCFICDSPARAYIKGVCNFNGIHGCLKCTTVGEYSHKSHTVTFPDLTCPNRIDEDFRKKKYGQHHKVDTPLLQLSIDMIQDFPVSDSLHLIDLGIMKRFLIGWRDGNFGKYLTKWSARDISIVSEFLCNCKMPSEIHRAVRDIDCLAFWKATEFRTFFYYLSLVILPHVLNSDVFQHFLLLYCSITICSTTIYQKYLPLSKRLLQDFVHFYKDYYGKDYVTSNVHNLIHVTDEVEKFGPLHTYNAYPFENKLFIIKNMIRQGNKPLVQVAKRLNEDSGAIAIDVIENKKECGSFVTIGKKMSTLHCKSFIISSKSQDKYFLLITDEIAELMEISNGQDKINLHCRKITNTQDVFEKPIKSSYLNIYKASKSIDTQINVVLHPEDIKCKLVCVEYKNYYYFIPLVHTL